MTNRNVVELGATSRKGLVAPCHPRRKGSSKDGGSRKRLWVSAGHHAALERAMAGWCWHAVPARCKSGNHGDFHNCYIVIPSYYRVTIINMYVSIYIYAYTTYSYVYIYMHIVYIVYCILIKQVYICIVILILSLQYVYLSCETLSSSNWFPSWEDLRIWIPIAPNRSQRMESPRFWGMLSEYHEKYPNITFQSHRLLGFPWFSHLQCWPWDSRFGFSHQPSCFSSTRKQPREHAEGR